jgi:hypothetical protein
MGIGRREKYRRHSPRTDNVTNNGTPPYQRTNPTHHHNLWRPVSRQICLRVGYQKHNRHPAGRRVYRQSTPEPKGMIYIMTCNGAK